MGCGSCKDMEMALKDEEGAVISYKEAAKRAKLPELRAMFEMLSLHEEGHARLLRAMLEKHKK